MRLYRAYKSGLVLQLYLTPIRRKNSKSKKNKI